MAGQIAQLIIPADGGGNPNYVVPDWARDRLYFGSQSALRRYRVVLETQTPTVSSLAYTTYLQAIDVDPVSGSLIAQRPAEGGTVTNYTPLWRYNPDTFAVTATIGTAGASGAYPTAFWGVEWIICAGCGTAASGGATQVGYAFLKESAFSGVVSVVRTDGSMAAAGFSQAIISGATDNRANGCRGKSGPTGASVFITWSGQVNGFQPTLPLHTVEIAPGAETYDPASWPTANPHITSRLVGTIFAASVDPTWTKLSCNSLVYDPTDGNVLLQLTTNDAVANTQYLVKVSAANAAVIWTRPAPRAIAVNPGLAPGNISHQQVGLIHETSSSIVATGTGALTTAGPFGGVTYNSFPETGWDQSRSDDVSRLYLLPVGSYNAAAPNAPTPAAGTPASFANSYALVGGLFPALPKLALDDVVCTTIPALALNLISLRWSDDRGRSYGSPVTQPMGEAGEYRTSLQWQRLAYARDRVFEVSWSVACRTALQGCWIDVTPAGS
jgi:hypothetical protein